MYILSGVFLIQVHKQSAVACDVNMYRTYLADCLWLQVTFVSETLHTPWVAMGQHFICILQTFEQEKIRNFTPFPHLDNQRSNWTKTMLLQCRQPAVLHETKVVTHLGKRYMM